MNSKLLLSLLLTRSPRSLGRSGAPPILNYAGQVSVMANPYRDGQFKFAFVDERGQFSYWSHDGQRPPGRTRIGQPAGRPDFIR